MIINPDELANACVCLLHYIEERYDQQGMILGTDEVALLFLHKIIPDECRKLDEKMGDDGYVVSEQRTCMVCGSTRVIDGLKKGTVYCLNCGIQDVPYEGVKDE